MNKFMKVLMVTAVSVGMLSGCSKPIKFEDKATNEEISLIRTINLNKFNSCRIFSTPIKEAIALRGSKPVNVKPFQDIKGVVLTYDASNDCRNTKTTYQELYFEIYREPLFTTTTKVQGLSSEEGTENLLPTQVEVNKQVISDTITLKDETLLSPKKIRELTNSVGTCNSAKVKLIMLTDTRKPLTISDYEVVTELIVGCEMDLLREELNK